jgi:cyanophycinase-like exopeptidase
LVNDNPGGYNLYLQGDSSKQVARHYLVLFGSGEIAPSSVSIYRDLFLTFGKRDLKIALITTPAGFQPNVARVYGEIKDFLLASLPDFNLDIQIVFANTLADANNPEIVSQLDGVDIIFTGPGSPTYAAKHLRGTLLLTKIIDRVKNGVTLILASAATISFSHFALPVYEIYKVGDDLHWESGLDLYNDV